MKNKNINTHTVNEKYKNISIAVNTSLIEIIQTTDKECTVECHESRQFSHSVKVEDETLYISRRQKKWYSYLLPDFRKSRITLYVPKIKLDTITVKSNTSKVYTEDIACKNLTITVNTGKVTLESTTAKDKLHIKTNTGKINLYDSDACDIYLKSNTGNITGYLLTNKAFVIRSKTGKVSIPDTFGRNRCEIISNTGNIYFEITPKEKEN